MAKKRELSDMQKAFVVHLVGDAKGDFVVAKKMAGYSDSTPVREIVASLKDEIIDAAKDILVMGVPRAAHAIVDQVSNPEKAGASISARAALEVLDRVGVSKATGEVSLKIPEGGLVILPAKMTSPFDPQNGLDTTGDPAENEE